MIVYTGGTFDLLHPGHLYLLRQCRKLAGPNGKVVVSLNTDGFVQVYKNVTVTHSLEDRRKMMLACRDVDMVVINTGGKDSKVAIEVIRPDIIAIGEDWKDKNYYEQMQFTQEWLDEHNIKVKYLKLLPDRSSTRIRRSLAGGATTNSPGI